MPITPSFTSDSDGDAMKTVQVIFAALFLLIITTPLVLLDRNSEFSMLERRWLAQPPKITANGTVDAKLLETLPRQIDAYIIDRFGGRSLAIFCMNNINFLALGKSHDSRLLVGRDRWLFYIDTAIGDEFANFNKSNLYTESELAIFLDSFTQISDYCNGNNIKFIFLIIPDKPSLYPEKYPFPRPKGIALVEQILNALPENQGEKIIFPLDYFLSKKKESPHLLYFNNGLHWTKLGAYHAYELLYENLKADFPGLPTLQFSFTPYRDTGEDNYALWWGIQKFSDFLILLNVAPIDGWGNHYSYVLSNDIPITEYSRPESIAAMKGKFGMLTKNKDNSLPTALIMRDSYFVTLEPFISSIFSEVEYVWTQPEKRNLRYLMNLSEKPDVFIWEIGERGLKGIPLMPPGVLPYD